MICWLQGKRIENWQQSLKQGIVLSCSGVGYEVQLLPRHLSLICSSDQLTLWIHQVKRDDGESLYGFQSKSERNLFRKLLSVNGVGPQIAMALLEEVHVHELVSAIISEDIHTLSKAQGIGKRTAERLSIELRHKLEEFNGLTSEVETTDNKQLQKLPMNTSIINELQGTLRALGYEDHEISKAIRKVAKEFSSKNVAMPPGSTPMIKNFDGLIKSCLIWLSNESMK